jgi:hypothetical protein
MVRFTAVFALLTTSTVALAEFPRITGLNELDPADSMTCPIVLGLPAPTRTGPPMTTLDPSPHKVTLPSVKLNMKGRLPFHVPLWSPEAVCMRYKLELSLLQKTP